MNDVDALEQLCLGDHQRWSKPAAKLTVTCELAPNPPSRDCRDAFTPLAESHFQRAKRLHPSAHGTRVACCGVRRVLWRAAKQVSDHSTAAAGDSPALTLAAATAAPRMYEQVHTAPRSQRLAEPLCQVLGLRLA